MTKLQNWWNSFTPTGKCLIAVGAAVVLLLVWVVV